LIYYKPNKFQGLLSKYYLTFSSNKNSCAEVTPYCQAIELTEKKRKRKKEKKSKEKKRKEKKRKEKKRSVLSFKYVQLHKQPQYAKQPG
jgi:hypothetical protein